VIHSLRFRLLVMVAAVLAIALGSSCSSELRVSCSSLWSAVPCIRA